MSESLTQSMKDNLRKVAAERLKAKLEEPTKAGDVLGAALERMAKIIPANQVPPESQRHDAEAQVKRLREEWGAPLRHATATPRFEGRWGESFKKLQARLGTGFTAALVGTRGNGKTQMAVELMRYLTGKGRSARFLTTTQFLQMVKATYRTGAEKTEADVIKELRRPRLLVLDEFASRGASDWEANQLFELLNQRYGDITDTLIIANMSERDFGQLAGDSLVSRINHGGGFVRCDWESFR